MVTGQEILRLTRLSRSAAPDTLLDEALNGRDATVDVLTRLMGFLTANIGQDSAVTATYWKQIRPRLAEAGVSEADLKKIRFPYLRPTDRNFKSILDEMREEGFEIP